ncbi:MAG TPA: hypothetical protein VKF63_05200 [Terracidiphilus sp.]|nr:hypothetical protein [Terracidiphilus sp.]
MMKLRSGVVRALAVVLVTGSALVLLNGSSLLAQNVTGTTNKTEFGVNTTTFQTPQGSIQVNLPDDVMAGDTLSGTVFTNPSGKNAKQQAKNADELNGYVVEVQNQKTQVSKKVLEWTVPTGAAGATAFLILRNSAGNEVARTSVPVLPARTDMPATSGTSGFHLPSVSQANRPMNIAGPFDGKSATTSVTIGGKPAQVLAESPRKIAVQSPSDVGLLPVHVQKGDAVADGTVRNLGMHLSATSSKLLKDDKATLTLKASGLTDLKTDVPIRLVNRSVSVVGLEGGEKQTVIVHPADVDPGGVFTMTRTLTGRETGAFDISALVAESIPEFAGGPGMYIANKQEGWKPKCEDCAAGNDNGPDTINPGMSCTAPSACVNNNKSLQWDIANTWCRSSNSDVCTGDCGNGNHCDGIYDSTKSNGLSVTANIVAANPLKCVAPLVTCDAQLVVAAGGTLACKCSCNPGN